MKAHKFAKYFPPMSNEQFQELVEDIKANGLIEPITTFEGKILDGVHRERACKRAKVKPRYIEWTDSNPLKWVVSKNLHRRHLTDGQKHMIQIDCGLLSTESDVRGPTKIRSDGSKLSTAEAAEGGGTSVQTVKRVKMVAREDSELADDIRSGKKSARLAHGILIVKKFGQKTGAQKETAVLLDKIERGEAGIDVVDNVLAACNVAYSHGDIGRVKELLRTSYNRHTHTAEAERQRQSIAEELDQKKKTQRQKMRWEDVPEVAAILRAFQGFRKATPEFIKALEIGKFSPEAKRFLAEKLGELITEVRGLLRQLEELKEKL